MPEKNVRKLTRKKVIEKAKQKYLTEPSENKGLFWDFVETEISYHAEKAAENRKVYFEGNEKRIRASSLLWVGEKHGKRILRAVEILLAAVLALWNSYMVKSAVLSVLFYFASFFLIVVVIRADYRAQAGVQRLKLRRYGETWVRHSSALGAFEQELLEFVCETGDYESAPLRVQQKRLEMRLLQIHARNQAQFEENMHSLEETAE